MPSLKMHAAARGCPRGGSVDPRILGRGPLQVKPWGSSAAPRQPWGMDLAGHHPSRAILRLSLYFLGLWAGALGAWSALFESGAAGLVVAALGAAERLGVFASARLSGP